ncbi:MAG: hypothetical protein ACT4NL_04290 [Pseudomarimonas sp.]
MRFICAATLVFLAMSAHAQNPSFTLFPPCEPFECGDAQTISESTRPGGLLSWEEQSVRVEIAAEALLRDSQEHVAVAVLAGAPAFAANGRFDLPNGPGGGFGVAIGTFDPRAHPACPNDPSDTAIEFAIERFGWANPYASSLPVCQAIPIAVLDRSPVLELRLSARCYPAGSCSVNASLHDPATGALLTRLNATGLSLANPSSIRQIWAGTTNIQFDDPKRGARIRVLGEHYHAER